MNRLSAIVVMALSLGSCAGRLPAPPETPHIGKIKIVIDKDFGEYGSEAILSAIERWHDRAGICFDVSVADVSRDDKTWGKDQTITIYLARDGWRKFVFDELGSGKNWIGLTTLPSRDIFIGLEYWALRQVAMHEIGHALCSCAVHSENRLSTMYWLALSGGIQDVTLDDARRVAELLPGHRCR